MVLFVSPSDLLYPVEADAAEAALAQAKTLRSLSGDGSLAYSLSALACATRVVTSVPSSLVKAA
jgi:hypothetical protein